MYFLRARYMNPGTGRFHTQDSYAGRNGEPLSLHKYVYANANPVMGRDPSGHVTLEEMSAVEGELMSENSANISVGQGITVQANYASGKAWEVIIENVVKESTPTAQFIGRQIAIRGPGGLRYLDLLYKVGGRLVAIEAKTNLPLGGAAFSRLVGQVATYAIIDQSALVGADILVATKGFASGAALIKAEAAFAVAAAESAGSVRIIEGVVALIEFLKVASAEIP
jgi:hypothetical protein